MLRNDNNFKDQIGTEKSFGIVIAVFFLLVGFYPVISSAGVRSWSIAIGFVFLVLAFFSPKVLIIPNKIWFKLGELLGLIVSPIVITIIYCTTVIPIGMIFKLIGKDLLQSKFDDSLDSYWIERNQSSESMRDQF
jgi:hypothetical protein|tara:strand:- start:2054 stop:2458 length:405 start_codon:yes stop_codon:yes gene_type:complete